MPVEPECLLNEPSPRTHYQLLGISADECDPRIIEEAAVRRSVQVRAYQLTRAPECTRLLGAIARALTTLLDPVRRATYDRGLGKPLDPEAASGRPAWGELALVPVMGGGKVSRPCDVELVFRA